LKREWELEMSQIASGINPLTDKDAREEKRKSKQRKRSIAIALSLFAMAVMFYIAAWVRFGGIVSGN
jgi:hypothetical protein